jgi:Protein of unknown function (DUF3631)
MTLPSPKVCKTIASMHASAIGGATPRERKVAYKKLLNKLKEYRLTTNDIPAILKAVEAAEARDRQRPAPDKPPNMDIYGLVLGLIETHVFAASEEHVAITLWVLHCWVFRRFRHTPRLALISPTSNCGKSETFELIATLVPEAELSIDYTAASLFRQDPLLIWLLDEFDRNRDAYAVVKLLHGGWTRGGSVSRYTKSGSTKFDIFTPAAVGAIGEDKFTPALLERSIRINLLRRPKDGLVEKFKANNPAFAAAHKSIEQWASAVQLDPEPGMGETQFFNRVADNWCVLFSIADSFGVGDEARAAAIKLETRRTDVEASIVLLRDIQMIFQQRRTDRISSEELVAVLHTHNDRWLDWNGKGQKLKQHHLARTLKPFCIFTRTIRLPGGGGKFKRGYYADDFSKAWQSYSDDTPTQTSKTIHLASK